MVSYRPHNVPFVALGAGLLWFGWFGFNGGSEFKADAVAALAILNTVTASAAGMVSWLAVEARAHRSSHAGGRQHRSGCGPCGGHAGRGL